MAYTYTSYTTVEDFKTWIPQKHLGDLSNDIDGSFDIESDKIKEALDWGAEMVESQLMTRDDIPIPAVDANGETTKTIKKAIHTIALFWLFERRGHISDQVQTSFDIQMTWLADVRSRRANIKLVDESGEEQTKTTETPIIDGTKERGFDDFTFG